MIIVLCGNKGMTTEEALNEVKGRELGNGKGPTQQSKNFFFLNKMEQGCMTTTEGKKRKKTLWTSVTNLSSAIQSSSTVFALFHAPWTIISVLNQIYYICYKQLAKCSYCLCANLGPEWREEREDLTYTSFCAPPCCANISEEVRLVSFQFSPLLSSCWLV